jgi:hypothetical protein
MAATDLPALLKQPLALPALDTNIRPSPLRDLPAVESRQVELGEAVP